ncbi:N-acetylneuraminate synthase [Agromyces sp. CFH 90414]|uniref:N-acetylneuraminate synthase n=1 Tax=Agromyces agglutinans TaxID=2662258 RepID=A0A6I2FA13_9MICO|nr:N-acetylneuraminate synthase family protein [Agromyces agglutinans]MRG61064.1 N-acetylneuraminate synthase [Agromyces agglutinans]
MSVRIGRHEVGDDRPVYVIAEIGLNHNGDLELAKRLIDVAAASGCQAVKFQKRTPELATPEHMKDVPRETPWGTMTYLDYRRRVEFGLDEYLEVARYADLAGLDWFASPWDEPSVDFLEAVGTAAHKVASASVTDLPLLRAIAATGKPVILSTGMSTIGEIDEAVATLGGTETGRLVMLHATSSYPMPHEEANLRTIQTLRGRYEGVPIGYSGHERGLQISLAAVALGAVAVERHITLDRTMWGSDHSASLEPQGLEHLVRDIRIIETAMGDGVKRVFPGELAPKAKLRRVLV